ncbi:hypothetical protein [Aliivibrio fischeri]|uniref:hypothetical protein n=1 Tax=Aliivibrio fischeri TaxID=668 RepID=UPI001112FBAA|nr:hypothetical protein [Aliivibrio fischeri]MUK26068.1 hypothetical protein [Aliivibrio fischeri]MUK33967.1 hypothetical protein [Aliivibrio fischeri]
MNKFISFSIALLFSSNLLASEVSFGVLKTMFPGETVKEFSLADINNDGNDEIIIITDAGELKYAEKADGGLLNDEDLSYLLSTRAWDIKTSISGATNSPSLYVYRGETIYLSQYWGSNPSICEATPIVENGHIVAKSGSGKITITSVTQNKIVGKLSCVSSPLTQSEEVSFTAIKR